MEKKAHQVKYDHQRKMFAAYREQRHSARNSGPDPIQHDYSPNSQAPDVSPKELDRLCVEYYDCEVRITPETATDIEVNTREQSDSPIVGNTHQLQHSQEPSLSFYSECTQSSMG